jgi:hypothetical protein
MGVAPPFGAFERFDENDLHTLVDQCAKRVEEAEDHPVPKGLFW